MYERFPRDALPRAWPTLTVALSSQADVEQRDNGTIKKILLLRREKLGEEGETVGFSFEFSRKSWIIAEAAKRRIMALATLDVYTALFPLEHLYGSRLRPDIGLLTSSLSMRAEQRDYERRNRRTGTTHGPFPRLRNYRNPLPRPR